MEKYKKNFLKQVIVRADFINGIRGLDDVMPSSIHSSVSKCFPIAEPSTTEKITVDMSIDSKATSRSVEKTHIWDYYSQQRDRRLSLASNYLFLEWKTYDGYEQLEKCFMEAFNAVSEHQKDLQVGRLGLRYIDEIAIEGDDPLDWSEYLNDSLLAIIDVADDKTAVSRAFHNLELNKGEYMIRFQYGIWNPDYPTPVVKKRFILDTDVYCIGILTKGQIETCLPIFHSEALRIFEISIKDRLREIMNE